MTEFILFILDSYEENLPYWHIRPQETKIFLRLRGATTSETQAKANTHEMRRDIYKNVRDNNRTDGTDIDFCSI